MSIVENIRLKTKEAFEIITTSRSELKQRAQLVVDGLHQSKDFRLITGVISQEELDKLAQNPSQEVLYKDMFNSYLRKGTLPENTLSGLSLAQQTDIGTRHTKWLTKRFGLE